MLIFLASGQLGNQLFQYAFLKTIQKNNETIVVSRVKDLKVVFENIEIIHIKSRKLTRWLTKFLTLLDSKKIISSIQVNHEYINSFRREKTSFTKKEGKLRFITFVREGYFQSEKCFNYEKIQNLKIKQKYLKTADNFLKKIPANAFKVFVHVRIYDEDWKVFGKTTNLPLSYYKNLIKYFLKKQKNCYFIFLSNEPEFVKMQFSFLKQKIISYESFQTDFTIMTKCDGAILAPSSFSWWGSYFMKNKNFVFAPKYWLGFASKKEYHAKPIPNFAKQIEI